MPLIEVRGLTKYYRMGDSVVRALDGVDLNIEHGDFIAITGASGSGKSTMMHLLGCLDRPTAGSYCLNGTDVSGLNDRQLADARNKQIGFVFQTFNLINRTSAAENVAVPLFYARQTNTRAPAMRALERVGLGTRAHHNPNELSGGERQRVAIARAIVNDPVLLLADEPTGNLDSRTGDQIMEIFHQLNAQGVTIVIVTHEPEIAAQTRRIVNMRDGKIVSDEVNDNGRALAEIAARRNAPATVITATAPGIGSAAARSTSIAASSAAIASGGAARSIGVSRAADAAVAVLDEPPTGPATATRPTYLASQSRAGDTTDQGVDVSTLPKRMIPGATSSLVCGVLAALFLIVGNTLPALMSVFYPAEFKAAREMAGGPPKMPAMPVIVAGVISLVAFLATIVPAILAIVFARGATRRMREEIANWVGRVRARIGFWLGVASLVVPVLLIVASVLIKLYMKPAGT